MLLYPYKMGSKSAKELARQLGAKRIKHKGSKLRGRPHKTVINWGAPQLPAEVHLCRVINKPEHVARAGDKLLTFRCLGDTQVRIPEWTEDEWTARDWVMQGSTVFARTLLRANSGRGIHIIDHPDVFKHAPLYVKYKKSKSEWRVHVMQGKVIAVHRKIRDPKVDPQGVDFRIRNYERGFIFQRHNEVVPEDVTLQSLAAVESLMLDFGAVDVIFNEHEAKAYVLEVNTAPGLTGETLDVYAKTFRESY